MPLFVAAFARNALVARKTVVRPATTLPIALILLKRARNHLEGSNEANSAAFIIRETKRTPSLSERDKQHRRSSAPVVAICGDKKIAQRRCVSRNRASARSLAKSKIIGLAREMKYIK